MFVYILHQADESLSNWRLSPSLGILGAWTITQQFMKNKTPTQGVQNTNGIYVYYATYIMQNTGDSGDHIME